MAQHVLQVSHVDVVLNAMGGERMAQRMDRGPRVRTGLCNGFSENASNTAGTVLTTCLAFEQPVGRFVFLVISPQQEHQLFRQYGLSVFFAFAVLYKKIAVLRVHVRNPQVYEFGNSQSGTVYSLSLIHI